MPNATPEKVSALVAARRSTHPPSSTHVGYAAYRAEGGYTLAAACINGERTREDVIASMEDSGLRGLGGAGFLAGRSGKSLPPSQLHA